MTLENGSASSNARTIACPSWLALPRVSRSNQYTERGHGKHGFSSAVLSGKPIEEALLALPEGPIRETCRRIDWRKLVGDLTDLETEVAYAIDVKKRTVRLLGRNLGRNYGPLGPWEVPGTLDIAGKKELLRVVIDVKSGWQDVDEAEHNAQLLFFAAVYQLLEDRVAVECRIAKLKENGDVWIDRATFAAWEVDSYLDELEAALEASKESRRVYLAGGTPNVAEGAHCTYCEAFDSCPGKTRLARSMVVDLQGISRAIETATDDELRTAWQKAHDTAKPVLEHIIERIKDRARQRAVPLHEGWELREAPYDKTSVSTEALISLARKLGATDGDLAACQRRTTVRPVKACKTAASKPIRRSA